jgi:hypothetical protein
MNFPVASSKVRRVIVFTNADDSLAPLAYVALYFGPKNSLEFVKTLVPELHFYPLEYFLGLRFIHTRRAKISGARSAGPLLPAPCRH